MHKKQQNNNNKNSQWTRVTQLELRDDCQLPAWDAELLGDAGQTVGHGNFIRDPTRLDSTSNHFRLQNDNMLHMLPQNECPVRSYACLCVCVCCNTAPKVSDCPQPNSHNLFWVLPELVMDQSYAVCMLYMYCIKVKEYHWNTPPHTPRLLLLYIASTFL